MTTTGKLFKAELADYPGYFWGENLSNVWGKENAKILDSESQDGRDFVTDPEYYGIKIHWLKETP